MPTLFILLILGANLRQSDWNNGTYSFTHFSNTIQMHLGSAQFYDAPARNRISPITFDKMTIHASFMESFPVLGKPFRDRAGVKVYNAMINNSRSNDMFFPFSAEIFYNLGFVGLIIFNILIGYIYAHFNGFFNKIHEDNFLLKYCVFYSCLLFNATILLSVSVLGQFLFYLFFPIPIIFLVSKLNMKTVNQKM